MNSHRNKASARNYKDRRRHYQIGRLAEYAACLFLMLKGYRILARRVRTGAGEIDVIACKNTLLAFIEVKYRADGVEAALEAVTPRSRQRIVRAAEIWLAKHPKLAGMEQRFDIIAMQGLCSLLHLPDAWRP